MPDKALTTAEVHSTHARYRQQGNRSAMLSPVSDYLSESLPLEEERWARWERVDSLALLGRCEEMIAVQKEDLAWATARLPPDALLRVMDDSTQAACWLAAGRIEEWLTIFDTLMTDTIPTEGNRFERFYYLRTACHVLQESDLQTEAFSIVSRMRALIAEDPDWVRAAEIEVQALDAEARLFWSQQEVPRLRQAGLAATQRLEQQFGLMHGLLNTSAEKQSLQTGYDNIAATLFRAAQYDLSIPLHRRCLELGGRSEYVYLWLAAALWQTERQRDETLALLAQGASECWGSDYQQRFATLSEFAGVRSDPEFIAAVTREKH